jgi:tRNA nucleotidyltransferase/poly(A) polymerase
MSDYMFMLESHLSPEQFQVVRWMEASAHPAGAQVFLCGGAMRDMLGGFPIRDLDFTVEGNSAKLVRWLIQKMGAKEVASDDSRRAVELKFSNGVCAEVSQAHVSHYGRPGSKPEIKPATIHDDLLGRDFTINAIALSLNKGSRGLLLDPTNGLGDLELRELRACGNYTLYDDPSRILRMFRLRARLSFELAERTRNQYQNVREAELQTKITTRALLCELRQMADEPNLEQLLGTLDKEGLLALFLPALGGAKLDLVAFGKLHRALQLIPFGVPFAVNHLGLFLNLLTSRLSAKEKNELVKRLSVSKADVSLWQRLEPRAKKLEFRLKSARLNKASLVYQLLRAEPGEDAVFLLVRSSQRIVQDRVRNYLQKYLLTAHEVTEKGISDPTLKPGTPKFKKALDDLIFAHLDGRIRKPAPEPVPVSPPQPAGRGPMGVSARR